MQIEYHKEYSGALGRDMEFKSYGHGGVPMLAIPCQNGTFYEWEGFDMPGVLSPWIDSGRLRLFTPDTVDRESISDTEKDPRARIWRHEQYVTYLVRELIPRIHQLCQSDEPLLSCGFSMGAYHAANLFFRFPDLFRGVISLSGVYDTSGFLGGYCDDLVYLNDPCMSVSGMPPDHPYLSLYNQRKIILCVGQGAWEGPLLEGTRRFDRVLREKGINAWVDYGGEDVAHDWYWWKKQLPYFLGFVL